VSREGSYLTMRNDGLLLYYYPAKNSIIYSFGEQGDLNRPFRAEFDDDRTLRIYNKNNELKGWWNMN